MAFSSLIRLLAALVVAASSGLALASALDLAQVGSGPQSEQDFEASVRQERERIERERSALQASFDAQERECRQRFFVNRCLQELAPRRREALSRLREQGLQIEEAERARRQAAALARIEQKKADAQRPPDESPEQAAARVQREQTLRAREQAERQAQARERVELQQERERAAAERQRARDEAARSRARRIDAPPLPMPTPDGPLSPPSR